MIARILRLLLALQLLALAALWLAFARLGAGPLTAALAALALLLLLRALITAHNFWLGWRGGSATPDAYRPGPAARARLFGGEFAATLLTSSYWMAWPGPRGRIAAPGRQRGLPVLLIHGYVCNRGYWSGLSRLLARAGISYAALDLEPPGADLDDYVPLVRRALEELCAASGSAQAIIVAHSMGGLVARAYLRAHGAARVARLISVGTPHHGTGLARMAPGRNAWQMRHGGAWLAELAAAEDGPRRALITSIFSHHDNIVAPQTSAFLPGAKNLAFGAIGHVALGRHPLVLACVMKEIALASAAAAGAPPPQAPPCQP
ncbi:MAG TPA: lipase [Janthinobacterium sp.]|nr:lipase [Janthinobacterium sp.]